MTLEAAAGRMLGALTSAGIPHMLVGGFTSNFYGIPRATKDVDIVIQLADKQQLSALAKALGRDFDFDTQVTFETLTGNIRHIVRLPGTPFVIELFELGDDAFQQRRFARRVTLVVPQIGQPVSFPTPEDVVVQKIRWGRPKDLEDARDVLAVQGEDLEMRYIEMWCEKHGTLDRLKRLLAEIPEI
jgi:Nucleotidyl transferase of unknown function (DUF2204)